MLFKIIGAFIAVVAFCIMIELPKKYMVQAGMTGMVGWAVYLLMEMVASRVEIAALVSALCIATMSHILARVLKAPVSNFLIPGILPIVPRRLNIQMCLRLYKRVVILEYLYERSIKNCRLNSACYILCGFGI